MPSPSRPPRAEGQRTGDAWDLHTGYQSHRVAQLPAAQSDPQPRPVPLRAGALKVLYLAVRNLQDYRGPNTGTRSAGWKQALQAFTIYFEGRIPAPW